MAKKIEDTIKFVNNADNLMSFGKSFATLNGQPLDKDSIFNSKATAEAFAKTASAYVGKIVVVVESGIVTAYVINSDNTLKAIGDKGTIDDLTAKITALQKKDEAHDASIEALGNKDKEIEEKITQLDTDYKAADTELEKKITANTKDIATKAATSVVEGINTRLVGVEDNFTGNDANNALKLGGKEAKDYQLAAELKALAKKDKVAEADLEETLKTKINGKVEASDVETLAGRVTEVENNFNEEGKALDAVKLGGKAAGDYVLKTDKVAESNLDTALAKKINDKADAATVNAELAKKAVKTEVDAALKLKANTADVNKELALKATVVAQEATEAKAEQNKTDIARVEKEYKAADTALDTRLKAAEGKLKDVTNVMDFVGAVDKLPSTKEELAKYQKGDVIVVTGGKEAGLEYVYDGVKFVEIGNSSSEQAAIAELKEKDKTHDDLLTGLRTDVDLKATKEEVNTLTGVVAKKAEQSALEAATDRITAVEGEVDTLNAKPAFGITSDQISNWDKEVGAKAQANTNKQGLADLKAVVDHETTGLAATKKIADDAAKAAAAEKGALAKANANAADIVKLKAADTKHTEDIAANAAAIEAEKGALAKATANESALKTKVEQEAFDTLNDTVTNSATGLVKKVGDLDTAVKTKAAQSDLEALQNKVNNVTTGLDSKASTEALNAVKATADAAQTEEEVKALIGAAEIGQAQVTGLPEALAEKQTAAQVNALIQDATIKQEKVEGLPAALQALQAKDAELAGKITALEALKPAEAGAQVNKIESVKLNGVALDIAEDKSVNVELKVSGLQQDVELILDGGDAGPKEAAN